MGRAVLVEVRGQSVGVASLLPAYGSQGLTRVLGLGSDPSLMSHLVEDPGASCSAVFSHLEEIASVEKLQWREGQLCE